MASNKTFQDKVFFNWQVKYLNNQLVKIYKSGIKYIFFSPVQYFKSKLGFCILLNIKISFEVSNVSFEWFRFKLLKQLHFLSFWHFTFRISRRFFHLEFLHWCKEQVRAKWPLIRPSETQVTSHQASSALFQTKNPSISSFGQTNPDRRDLRSDKIARSNTFAGFVIRAHDAREFTRS